MTTLSTELNKVSDYFVWKSFEDGRLITNKKIQKLVYYAQAWNLVLNGNTLFPDQIEAWIHGPAVRALYNKYKKYGYHPIQTKPSAPTINIDEIALLEDLWSVYGVFDADYLEILSHSEKPWLTARGNADNGEPMAAIIDNEIMRDYYGERLKKAETVGTSKA